jgi:hypothetical protein
MINHKRAGCRYRRVDAESAEVEKRILALVCYDDELYINVPKLLLALAKHFD